MLPSDYKRKYRFRTDTTNERKYMKAVLYVTVIVLAVLWYLMK